MNATQAVHQDRIILEHTPATAFAGVASRAGEVDATGLIPPENWREIVESGYTRQFHPPEAGGTGADAAELAQSMEALARACPGTYWAATVSALLCGKLVATYSPASEHARLLHPLMSAERLACFGIVEAAAGSDASTLRTTVSRAPGGGFLINGEKSRITNAPIADLSVTIARIAPDDADASPGAEPTEPAEPEWCLAFVDLHQPGVTRYHIPHMGLRGMPWGGVIFDNAHVAARDVVKVPFGQLEGELAEGMSWGWLLISISSIAIAEAALTASVEHARERVSFGRPLAHMEGVQAQLADSRAQIDAARVLARRALAARVAGRPARDMIAKLKIYATEMAVQVLGRTVQIHGASGVTRGSAIERLYRDAQMNVIGGFTSNRLRETVVEGLGLGPAVYEPFDWLAASGLSTDPQAFG